MRDVISNLKREISKRGLALEAEQTFDLLAAEACESCCQDHGGGNGSCPPPKAA